MDKKKQVKRQVPILPKGFCLDDWILFRLVDGQEYVAQVTNFSRGGQGWLLVSNIDRYYTWVNLANVLFVTSTNECDPRARKRYMSTESEAMFQMGLHPVGERDC